ncbi:hypothetical protein V8G54_027298 [Vigna mungo]|uniref:DRBM domain-containing protein n=1 Tax=Vigna mungo TaxID=3915 RepID=A0AAQ3N1M4_VIGMU
MRKITLHSPLLHFPLFFSLLNFLSLHRLLSPSTNPKPIHFPSDQFPGPVPNIRPDPRVATVFSVLLVLLVEMYKNQLQELAQRSCFNLPSYTCIREGPDHAPRFKATVNFNGEIFESPHYCSTLRQAEHSAAEVALNSLSHRGPSHSLAAKILVSILSHCRF